MENIESKTSAETKEPPLALDIISASSLNFVSWQAEKALKIASGSAKQNGYSFLKSVAILNNTDRDILNASLEIRFQPDAIHCDPILLSCLEKHRTTEIDSFALQVDPRYLYELNEALDATMSFVLKDKDGNVLLQQSKDITLLPIEESCGEDRDPAILASFVTPNDDLVKELANKAALELKAKYGRSDWAGYQYHDLNKVMEELDALYLAIQKEGIHYSNPPASFEKTFQRVRLPRNVIAEKTATCLDFSLLFASLMENIGLNPMIFIIENHAFNGCWLEDETASAAVEDNPTPLLNAAAKGIDKLALINAVDASASSALNFNQAKENGEAALREAKPFLYALDIKRCRSSLIRPIPTPHQVNGKTEIEYDVPDNDRYIVEHLNPDREVYANNHAAKNKFDRWEEKLLDLDMRNNLINLHLGGNNLQILTSDALSLFAAMQGKEKLSLVPQTTEAVHDQRFLAYEAARTNLGIELPGALKENRLYLVNANGNPEEALISLARKENTEIEESGCNPLFLSLGAIKWFDNEHAASAGKAFFVAPLLLIPVSLPRRRSGEFFSLSIDFDGLQFNTTAFEYFKEFFDLDFSEFNDLLSDKSKPLDLRKVYNTIRSKITPMKGWALLDNLCSLSLFSFAHFVMWSDMKNYRNVFLQNKVVSSLVEGKQEWVNDRQGVTPEAIDKTLKPLDLAIPLSADSSQIQAISAAEVGESFVLDGPPGTGKSQTIANMIVNAMFHSKRVLFVAEKEVALQVVKDRLDKLGLGSFCLQIHSAKANKKDVLSQLQAAMDIGQTKEPETYAQEAETLQGERNKLNATLDAIHQKKGYFLSIYDGIILYLQNEKYANKIAVDSSYVKALDEEKYHACLDALKLVVRYGHSVSSYHNNPFVYFQSRTYDMSSRDAVFNELPAFLTLGKHADGAAQGLIDLRFPNLINNLHSRELLFATLNGLQKDPKVDWNNLSSETYLDKKELVLAYLKGALSLALTKEQLAPLFKENVYLLDASAMKERYEASSKLSLFKKQKERLSLLATLRKQAKKRLAVRGKALPSLLAELLLVQTTTKQLQESDPFLAFVYKDELNQTSARVKDDLALAEKTLQLASQIRSFDVNSGSDADFSFRCFNVFSEHPDILFSNEVNAFLSQHLSFKQESERLKSRYGFDFLGEEDRPDYLAYHLGRLAKVLTMSGRLSEWVEYLNLIDKAAALSPASLIAAYKAGKLEEDDLIPAYQANVAYRLVGDALAQEKMASLSSLSTAQAIAFYKASIERFNALTVQETAAKVTSHYPLNGVPFASSTDVYQLRHLCANGGRGRSLRGIFSDYGSLIGTLCPCYLMSPLSVAQYLEPGKYQFDLVIFDEASQIQTSEAIGSIARGTSVVIAGDQEQMPPSNYFTAQLSLDEDSYEFENEDLESLLDDAIVLHLPRLSLNWHYRSNHESLIAFSNNRFYENKLLTFPSPEDPKSHVSFVYVAGNYEKGRGVNKDEANAIVQEVLRRLNDKELAKQSIGIVTFNEKQENLIQNLLEEKVYSNPSLTAIPGGESIFVKNLENVQGDERDVILFSICFGPDKKTHIMPLNFGPLSREKGERRLNVAVSRARDEMMIFSSVLPEEIRSEQAKNEGASYLKNFLSYAKYGIASLSNIAGNETYIPAPSIADFLAEDLRKIGFDVDVNVGTSSFRVDLAIKDPKDPNQYALGILCDSSSYADSPSCRDRNIVQPAILERLHWKLYRVWSVEYLDHPEEVAKRILETMKQADASIKPAKNANPVSFTKKEVLLESIYPHKVDYPSTDYSKEDDVLDAIIEREWPLSQAALEKRYRDSSKLSRISDATRKQMLLALKSRGVQNHSVAGLTYFYPGNANYALYESYRPVSDRPLYEIPAEEIGNAMKDLLLSEGAMSQEDLFKQISVLFGSQSLSARSRGYLLDVLHYLVDFHWAGLTRLNDGTIKLSE